MAKPKAEQSVFWLGTLSSLTFVVALFFTGILPSLDKNLGLSQDTAADAAHYHAMYQPDGAGGWVKVTTPDLTKPVIGYTPQQERGRLVYQREGCMYCHSQQIRPLESEMIRYAVGSSPAPAADEREYIFDKPHFLGTKRNGPDLSREGGKYVDDWHYSHFYNPAQMVPGSIMPAFTWLFTNRNAADSGSAPVPTQDARDLVAYVQSLGMDRQVFDPTMNGGKGAWRPWLKPSDAITSQTYSQMTVERAKVPVRVRGGEKASTPFEY